LTAPRDRDLDVRTDRTATLKEGCTMAATNVRLRILASVGALVLITGCGAATADVSGPPDGDVETPGPSDGDDGNEPSDDPESAGGEYRLDCRKRGSEILPC
jgi:hypothetical protein